MATSRVPEGTRLLWQGGEAGLEVTPSGAGVGFGAQPEHD